MTPAASRASHRRLVAASGETVTLRRYSGTGAARAVSQSATVRAAASGYAPAQLVGNVKQGDTKLIVLAEDFEGETFDLPQRNEMGLRVVIGTKEASIEAVDDVTRRVQGVLIAYEFQARG